MKILSPTVEDLYLSSTVMSAISDIQLSDIIDMSSLSNTFYMKSQTSSNIELSSEFKNYKTYDDSKKSLSTDGYLTKTSADSLYQAKGNYVSTSLSIAGHALTANIAANDISTAIGLHNSQITIVQGGIAKGTFTLNQDDDMTLSIDSLSIPSDYKTYDDTVSSLSDDGYVVSDDLDNYLDKHEGGEVSGDVAIVNHDFKVLSGNYVQTTDDVDVYGGKNAFIQANINKASYGKSSVGSRGFYVLSVIGTNKLKLSGDISIPSTAYNRLWSVSLGDKLDSQFSPISSVDGQIVTFKSPFDSTIQAMSISSESQLTSLIADDDNAFYCPTDATLGNVILNFYGQHAEGGSVHALAQYSHAEGRGSIAEGRYAHAEGNITTAGGAGAHAEGMYSKALGNRSHAEGERTYALEVGCHAEGYDTSAYGVYSHAEGYQTKADGRESHAEGYLAIASGTCSHAEGSHGYALSDYAHAEGVSCIASAIAAHTEGYQTSALNEIAAHAEGAYTKAAGNSSHAEGYGAVTQNRASHAEGYQTSAIAQASHAEGVQSEANGSGAHAEGGAVLGTTPYKGGTASGVGSHAGGYKTLAKGNWSYAGGEQTSAVGRCTFAIGDHAQALSDDMFVWNGIRNSTYKPSDYSATSGNFCINPVNGLSGFYIGKNNFIQCVLSAVSLMNTTQLNALKSILGI